jgi:hypothetical protein
MIISSGLGSMVPWRTHRTIRTRRARARARARTRPVNWSGTSSEAVRARRWPCGGTARAGAVQLGCHVAAASGRGSKSRSRPLETSSSATSRSLRLLC